MQRSRSGSRLIETAFVSRNPSSLEDLDEVDRLANHPVLRPSTAGFWYCKSTQLRKSRSEMGGFAGRASSSAGGSSKHQPVKSAQHSPVTPGSFGCRTMGVAIMKMSKRYKSQMMFRLNHGDASSASPSSTTPSSWTLLEENRCSQAGHFKDAKGEVSEAVSALPVKKPFSKYIVAAVVESEPRRGCITPPADCKMSSVTRQPDHTPPNTAPLPTKFDKMSHHISTSNLLKKQLLRKAANTASSTVTDSIEMERSGAKCPFLLADSSRDSSSTDSTPQRRKPPLPSKPKLSFISSRASGPGADHSHLHCFMESNSQTTDKAPQPSRFSQYHRPQPFAVNRARSRFFRAESESCSSAVSSLESVRSTESSEGIHSIGSSSDLSTSGLKQIGSAKFQVLSPISDKSQEQSSDPGDPQSGKTPKASPTDHILACCGGIQEENLYQQYQGHHHHHHNHHHNQNHNQNHQADNANNLNNNDEPQRPAPFFMPKLQRRLQEQEEWAKHGSDSGISMASQDVQDIYELLQLPFDMPKLRRKTQNMMNGLSRPQSVPNRNEACVPNPDKEQQDEQNCYTSVGNLNQLSHPDHNKSMMLPLQKRSNFSGPVNLMMVPPPPDGFVDDTNQFYMPQPNEDIDRLHQECEDPIKAKKLGRRMSRPSMTLSFGINASEKTLMFATNSPFDLNDCAQINPNLPLDRQDWYHGAISRQEAEATLRTEKEGSYLVRNVDFVRQEFALSLKSAKGFMHMRIRRQPSNRDFQLSDFERRFVTIPEMVHHYTRNRLPIKGAEHMCLKHPVPIHLL